MKSFALAAVIFLVAMAAHAAPYEVTIDGNKYRLSEDKEQKVNLKDGRRASVTVTTLGGLFWVGIDGIKMLLTEGKEWAAPLKDGGRVIVSVTAAKGDPKVFQGYGISFRYPSDMEITQESSPESASVKFDHDGVTMFLEIWLTKAPTKKNMDENMGSFINYVYKKFPETGARFPKTWQKPSQRSVGGVVIEGVAITYFQGEFEGLIENYLVPHNGRILEITIITNDPERKARHDSLINYVLGSLK